MSDENVSRRDLLRQVALAVTAGGMAAVSAEAAQHVHHAVAEQAQASGGVYQPKCLNEHEYKTLERLCDLIVPADDHSPGALAGGAPQFIDLLASQNAELAAIYTGGISWLDHEMEARDQAQFLTAPEAQQAAMLDLIAWREHKTPELAPGIEFFDWVRKMTVDAFYTSPVGIKDLGYMGNQALGQFVIPEEAIQYALKRSPSV